MRVDLPYWPPSDIKTERALGRFLIAWNVLERQIDATIHDLLRAGRSTGLKVTANLAIRAKLDLAHALFEEVRDAQPFLGMKKSTAERLDALVNETASANAEARIPIVHSQPTPIELEEGTFPFWIKWAARKGGIKGSGITFSAASVDAQTDKVRDLVARWHQIRVEMEGTLRAYALADADRLLGEGPDEDDSLRLQIQEPRGSQPATPKPPRTPKPSRRAKREAREALEALKE
jgi:hypothetical protein